MVCCVRESVDVKCMWPVEAARASGRDAPTTSRASSVSRVENLGQVDTRQNADKRSYGTAGEYVVKQMWNFNGSSQHASRCTEQQVPSTIP